MGGIILCLPNREFRPPDITVGLMRRTIGRRNIPGQAPW